MLLYVDAVTGGEICTDSFKITKTHDGAIWEIASKRVVKGGDVDVDIGCGNAFGGGGDEEEAIPAGAETVLDIVDAHNLVSKRVVKGGDVSVDIGCGNAFGGGGDEEDAIPAGAETVLDIVDAHNLTDMGYSQKEYKKLMKKYWKSLQEALKKNKKDADESKMETAIDEAKALKKKFKADYEKLLAFVEDVCKNHGEYDFFVATPSREFEAEHGMKAVSDAPIKMIIPASYPDGAVNPTFHIIAAGLKGVKY